MELDRTRAALLLMDLQTDIVARLGDKGAALVERAARLAAAARAAGVPVIYVVVHFRPGYPELRPGTPMATVLAGSGRFVASPPGSDIVPAVAPRDGDVVVVKHRVSAFFGTDLDVLLRARGVDTLVLSGVATSGVVLSTVRHGSDADYRVVVVEDACGDADDEVHRVLTGKVFARQTTVTSTDEVVAALA